MATIQPILALLFAAAWGLSGPLFAQQANTGNQPPPAGLPGAVSITTPAPAATPAPAPLSGAEREQRIEVLEQQRASLRAAGRTRQVLPVLGELTALLEGDPRWGARMLEFGSLTYQYGSLSQGAQILDRLVYNAQAGLAERARAGPDLAFMLANNNEFEKAERALRTAQSLLEQWQKAGASQREVQEVQAELTRGQMYLLRQGGRGDAAIAAGREGAALAQALLDQAKNEQPPNAARVSAAQARMDSIVGPLTYTYISEGRPYEALAIAERGYATAKAEKHRDGLVANWMMRLTSAYTSAGKTEQAQKILEEAYALFKRLGAQATGNQLSTLYQEDLNLAMARGDWAVAEQRYRDMLDLSRGDPVALGRLANARTAAMLAAKNGRFDEALQTIESNLRYRTRILGGNHALTMESRVVRGFVSLQRGNPSIALADYNAFFSTLLDNPASWQDLEAIGQRSRVMNVVLQDFIRHVASLTDKPESQGELQRLLPRTIQLLDRSAVGVTQQAISDAAARVRATTPALQAMVDKEQTARGSLRDAHRIITALVNIDASKLEPEPRKEHNTKLTEARKLADERTAELNKSRAELAKAFPAYNDLVSPPTPDPSAIQQVLQRGEVMVGIHPMREFTLVWLIGNGQVKLHRSSATETSLSQAVIQLRAQLDVGATAPDQIKPFDTGLAHQLYSQLLAPLAGELREAKSLLVSAQGALASLPLAVLLETPALKPDDWTTMAWLGKRLEIVQVPSASALVILRKTQAAQAAQAFIGFGDPDFANAARGSNLIGKTRNLVFGPASAQAAHFDLVQGFRYANMPPLPDTRDELIAIAGALKADAQRDLLLGTRATRPAVLQSDLASRRVVAFATHGLLPGELPGLSRPALAMANMPPGESPLLALDDVLTLKMNAQLVLLSACNTAAGDQDGAAMSGLVRGFFFAGGRSVLATHWAVDSEASKALMTRTFSLIGQGQGRATALRAAQVAMMDGKLGPAQYGHPFFWAPYALFGDPVR
jgi:CHAT domain-containing protein